MIRKRLALPLRQLEQQAPDVAKLPASVPPPLAPKDSTLKASLVLERLYLGDIVDARNEAGLRKAGVTHIVSCCPEQSTPTFAGISYHPVNILDRGNARLAESIPDACRFIANGIAGGGTVLVHCAAGVSRSTAIVIAYRMLLRGEEPTVALDYIKHRRPSVYPNIGFLLALTDIDRQWREAREARMHAGMAAPCASVPTASIEPPYTFHGHAAGGAAERSVELSQTCGSTGAAVPSCASAPIKAIAQTPPPALGDGAAVASTPAATTGTSQTRAGGMGGSTDTTVTASSDARASFGSSVHVVGASGMHEGSPDHVTSTRQQHAPPASADDPRSATALDSTTATHRDPPASALNTVVRDVPSFAATCSTGKSFVVAAIAASDPSSSSTQRSDGTPAEKLVFVADAVSCARLDDSSSPFGALAANDSASLSIDVSSCNGNTVVSNGSGRVGLCARFGEMSCGGGGTHGGLSNSSRTTYFISPSAQSPSLDAKLRSLQPSTDVHTSSAAHTSSTATTPSRQSTTTSAVSPSTQARVSAALNLAENSDAILHASNSPAATCRCSTPHSTGACPSLATTSCFASTSFPSPSSISALTPPSKDTASKPSAAHARSVAGMFSSSPWRFAGSPFEDVAVPEIHADDLPTPPLTP